MDTADKAAISSIPPGLGPRLASLPDSESDRASGRQALESGGFESTL
jgi:hypothetical protein